MLGVHCEPHTVSPTLRVKSAKQKRDCAEQRESAAQGPEKKNRRVRRAERPDCGEGSVSGERSRVLACAGVRTFQTGMRGAFGKPQGTVARVHIGQVIMSIRTKLQNKEHVIEALRRAKFKFPGRQKIHISKKWGFTKFNANEFEDMVVEKRLIPDGCGVKYISNRGPLDKWLALHS
ncbi:60S ribosomal protein L10 [Microtus ochrogaster]|uniref:60S ribosomal protein L10 n=1 Tax=Microtus ochrogaster TaxID=79684 RepID=A0A8J6G030_MICOH|nr:60S ribosomal protein L10 [Microtus ochrogaster]